MNNFIVSNYSEVMMIIPNITKNPTYTVKIAALWWKLDVDLIFVGIVETGRGGQEQDI